MTSARSLLRACYALIVTLTGLGCGSPLYLGSDLIWSAQHESGSLAEWTDDPGSFLIATDSAAASISDAHARRGHSALSITRNPMDQEGGPAIGHAADLPQAAYYGAWLFLRDHYALATYWTILQFRSLGSAADPNSSQRGADLRLRRLPQGQFVLYVFQHDDDYLQYPLADPPPFVPVSQWFHVEVFFRHATDTTGVIRVWLDGRLVYDLPPRRTAVGLRPWFGVASESDDTGPVALELLADDVTISHSRATPDELLDPP